MVSQRDNEIAASASVAERSEERELDWLDAGSPSSCRVSLSLLAGFHLVVDDQPILLPFGVQRVVAFVALQHQAVARSFIVGSLWPDGTEDQARASLRSALWRLRRLQDAVIVGNAAQLALSPSVQSDIAEISDAARRLESGDWDLSDHHIFRLFSSELLPGWYDDWVVIARERFRFAQLRALEGIAEHARLDHRLADAEAAYLAAAALEPFKESVQRGLIQVHLLGGSPGEAIRRYRAYRQLLSEELGAEPSEQMEALLADLRAGVTAG